MFKKVWFIKMTLHNTRWCNCLIKKWWNFSCSYIPLMFPYSYRKSAAKTITKYQIHLKCTLILEGVNMNQNNKCSQEQVWHLPQQVYPFQCDRQTDETDLGKVTLMCLRPYTWHTSYSASRTPYPFYCKVLKLRIKPSWWLICMFCVI